MAGVKWYGEGVFLRETVAGAGMSASQVFPLVPGTLIYNRLFAWKASFAVVPDHADGWHVSNEFPQFTVDSAMATAEFLRLFCLTRPVLDAVNRASAGSAAVSRNRLKESAFLDLDIALPPLPTQRAIVGYWNAAQADAVTMEREAEGIEREATTAFLATLGFKTPGEQSRRRVFGRNWSQIERWSFDTNHLAASPDSQSCKFQIVHLSEVISDLRTGWSPKCHARKAGHGEWGVLKLSAVTSGKFDASENKALPDHFSPRPEFEVRIGDVLITRGSGVTKYVGSAVFVENTYANLMASDLMFKVVFKDQTKISPQYLTRVLGTPFVRKQIEERRTGEAPMMQKITKSALMSLRIPLPPPDVQHVLIADITIAQQRADALRTQARVRRESAHAEVEAMILGQMPPPAAIPVAMQ